MPSWQMLAEMFLKDGLFPAVVAGATLLLAWLVGFPSRPVAAQWGAAVAVAGAFVAAQIWLDVAPWLPVASWHWLPYAGAAAAAAGVLEALLGEKATFILRVITAVLVTRFLVARIPDVQAAFYWWRLALGLTILLIWCVLDLAARGQDGGWLALLLGLVAVSAAGVFELSYFGGLLEWGGILAAALFGIALTAWLLRAPTASRGVVPVVSVLLPGMVFSDYWHTIEPPVASLCLLLAAPVLLGAVSLGVQRLPSRGWRVVLMSVAALVPAGVALALAALGSGEEW